MTLAGAVVRAGPYRICDHWSVWLEGKASGVDVEACTQAGVEAEEEKAMPVIGPEEAPYGSEIDSVFEKEIQSLQELINQAIRSTERGETVWIELGRRSAEYGLVQWSLAAIHCTRKRCSHAGWVVSEVSDTRSGVFFLCLTPPRWPANAPLAGLSPKTP